NDAHVGDVFLNDVDESGLAVVLNGGGGDQSGAAVSVNEQTDIYEFVGEECGVFVVERGAGFYGAGCGVDLIVEGNEGAGGKVFEGRAVVGVHGEFCVFVKTSLNLAEIVFRDSEDYGDGLDLRDNG